VVPKKFPSRNCFPGLFSSGKCARVVIGHTWSAHVSHFHIFVILFVQLLCGSETLPELNILETSNIYHPIVQQPKKDKQVSSYWWLIISFYLLGGYYKQIPTTVNLSKPWKQSTGDVWFNFDLIKINNQWIGLAENLQKTTDFPIKDRGFLSLFPVNHCIEIKHGPIMPYESLWKQPARIVAVQLPEQLSKGSRLLVRVMTCYVDCVWHIYMYLYVYIYIYTQYIH
jgi:hypothetical protein